MTGLLFCESTADCPFGIFPINMWTLSICAVNAINIFHQMGTSLTVENFPKNEITYYDSFYFYNS